MNSESINIENHTFRQPDESGGGSIYTGNWKIQLKSKKFACCPRMRKLLQLPKGYAERLDDFFELVRKDQVGALIEQFKAACQNGTRFEARVQVVTPHKTEKWILITGVLYARRWGAPDQMVGTIEDITQVMHEDCLGMAIVNHELRAPLTIIKLNTQFLLNHFVHSINKQPSRLLGMVDEHVNGMTRLIDEYLSPATSHDGAAKLNLSLSLFDVNALVDTVLAEMRVLYPGHRFCRLPVAGNYQVKADKYKITQVLINYLVNAAKFSPPCAPIHVGVDRMENDVEVSVHDQGTGINADDEQYLFRKFYECNSNAARQKNSKGLGLYIVKSIIENHCGTVKAVNGANGGAVFSFRLPLSVQSDFNNTGQEAAKLMA